MYYDHYHRHRYPYMAAHTREMGYIATIRSQEKIHLRAQLPMCLLHLLLLAVDAYSAFLLLHAEEVPGDPPHDCRYRIPPAQRREYILFTIARCRVICHEGLCAPTPPGHGDDDLSDHYM